MIPQTYWTLDRIGMIPKLKRSAFTKKHSVQFFNANGKASAPFYFSDNKDHESSQTWQVVRSEFDQMMLQNAREHGVRAHEGVRVLDVLFEGTSAVGVRVRDEDGGERDVRSRVVVDASGQNGLVMNKLGLRVWDPILTMGSVWTYYEGAHRDPGRDEGATLVLQTSDKNGWFWYLPLHDDIVSVGVVAPFEYLFKGRKDYEKTFSEELERCPVAKERATIGRRVSGCFATKDFSYRSKQVAGDGWVLVGDAFGFLDPLYSSGILLALKSGELAADAIVEGLASGNVSAAQLGRWGPRFTDGMDRMRRLICEYYNGFNFGNFVRQHPELRGAITDLLIGDLFDDRVDRVWKPMESLHGPDYPPIPGWDDPRPETGSGVEGLERMIPEGRKP
jgi:flavin-dependent dehydrogenase